MAPSKTRRKGPIPISAPADERGGPLDELAVEAGAVAGAEVAQLEDIAYPPDLGVEAGDVGVVEDDRVGGVATEAEELRRRGDQPGLVRGLQRGEAPDLGALAGEEAHRLAPSSIVSPLFNQRDSPRRRSPLSAVPFLVPRSSTK